MNEENSVEYDEQTMLTSRKAAVTRLFQITATAPIGMKCG